MRETNSRFAPRTTREPERSRLPIATSEWAATERLIELGGKAVDEIYMAQPFDRNDTSPDYLRFAKAYEARFQSLPGFSSIAAYDATRAALEAMARGATPGTMKQILIEKGPFPGAQQPTHFDRFGDSLRQALHTVVRDGQFVVVN